MNRNAGRGDQSCAGVHQRQQEEGREGQRQLGRVEDQVRGQASGAWQYFQCLYTFNGAPGFAKYSKYLLLH